jgi:hypothetical protein
MSIRKNIPNGWSGRVVPAYSAIPQAMAPPKKRRPAAARTERSSTTGTSYPGTIRPMVGDPMVLLCVGDQTPETIPQGV